MKIRLSHVTRACSVALLLALLLALPVADAALTTVGPINPENGFPSWYEDSNGLRLTMCLDLQGMCDVALPDPSAPISFPDNFPDEAVWWSGEAELAVGNGGDARLVMAVEGIFLNGLPAEGEQQAMNMLLIRADELTPNATYTFTHPYGSEVLTADGEGEIDFLDEVICAVDAQTSCDFGVALSGPIDPFLTWSGAPAPPEGYVGNPFVLHQVTGSPLNTNFFRIQGPNVGGTGVSMVQTNLFGIQGRLVDLNVLASPAGGAFKTAQTVTLSSSDPQATIYYTLDGSTPTDQSMQYTAPLAIDASTTLRFIAISPTAGSTAVRTERYAFVTPHGFLPLVQR